MAYTLVNNSTGNKSVSGTSPNFNMATAPTGGNLVILVMSTGGVPTSVTDNHSNTFTRATYAQNGAVAAIYYLKVPSSYGGTYTITMNFSGTQQVTCSAAEFAGNAATVDALDQVSTNTGTSTTPTTAATPTNGAYSSLVIICSAMEGFNPIWGFTDPAGGWTDIFYEVRNDITWTGAGCYRLTTSFESTTMPAQQWTGSENSNWGVVAATFKDTGADGAVTVTRRRVAPVYF